MSGRLLSRRIPSPGRVDDDFDDNIKNNSNLTNERDKKRSDRGRKRRRSDRTDSPSTWLRLTPSVPSCRDHTRTGWMTTTTTTTACDTSSDDDSFIDTEWNQSKPPPPPRSPLTDLTVAGKQKAWYDSSSDDSSGGRLKRVLTKKKNSEEEIMNNDTIGSKRSASDCHFRNFCNKESDSSSDELLKTTRKTATYSGRVHKASVQNVESSDESSFEQYRYRPPAVSNGIGPANDTTDHTRDDSNELDISRRHTHQSLPKATTIPSRSAMEQDVERPIRVSYADDQQETSSVDTVELDRRTAQQGYKRKMILQKHCEEKISSTSPLDDVFVLPDQPESSSSSDCSDDDDDDDRTKFPTAAPLSASATNVDSRVIDSSEYDRIDDNELTSYCVNQLSEEQQLNDAATFVPAWKAPFQTPHREIVDLCNGSTSSKEVHDTLIDKVDDVGIVRYGLRSRTPQYYPSVQLSSSSVRTKSSRHQLQDDIELFSDDECNATATIGLGRCDGTIAVRQLHQHRRTLGSRNDNVASAVSNSRQGTVDFDAFRWNDSPAIEVEASNLASTDQEQYSSQLHHTFRDDNVERSSSINAFRMQPNAVSRDIAQTPRRIRDPSVIPRLPTQSFLSTIAPTRVNTSWHKDLLLSNTLPRSNPPARISHSSVRPAAPSADESLPPTEDFTTIWAQATKRPFRNDLTGGSGSGVDSAYQFERQNIEKELPTVKARSNRRGRKAASKKSGRPTSSAKGSTAQKRGRSFRGKGRRGRGGGRAPPAPSGGNTNWAGNVDDPNLRHVGGAEMSF